MRFLRSCHDNNAVYRHSFAAFAAF